MAEFMEPTEDHYAPRRISRDREITLDHLSDDKLFQNTDLIDVQYLTLLSKCWSVL